MDIPSLIERYVDEVFDRKLNQYRFKPLAVTSTFKDWGDTHLGMYQEREALRHSSLRALLEHLDRHYAYHIAEGVTAITDSVKLVSPVIATNPPEGERGMATVVQNLVLKNAGQIPTVPSAGAYPWTAGFNMASDLMTGCWAYNAADDKWYYGASGSVKPLHNFSMSEITISRSQVGDLEAMLLALNHGILDEASARLAGIQAVEQSISTLTQSHTTHINNNSIHIPPDGVKVIVSEGFLSVGSLSNMLEPILPLAFNTNNSSPKDVLELRYNTTQFDVVEGVFTFIGSAGGGTSVDLSNYYTKSDLNQADGAGSVHWSRLTNTPSLLSTLSEIFEIRTDEQANPYLYVKMDLMGSKGITAYATAVATLPTVFDSMPVATADKVGGVMIGSGLTMEGGVLSVNSDTFSMNNYYTKVNLQTIGQAQVHWNNITNSPDIEAIIDARYAAFENTVVKYNSSKSPVNQQIFGNIRIVGKLEVQGVIESEGDITAMKALGTFVE